MHKNFSSLLKKVITAGISEAMNMKHRTLSVEHVFLSMLSIKEGRAYKMLHTLSLDFEQIRYILTDAVEKANPSKNTNLSPSKSNIDIPLSSSLDNVLKRTGLLARERRSQEASTEHLLLAILHDDESICTQLLEKYNVRYDTISDLLDSYLKKEEKDRWSNIGDDEDRDKQYDDEKESTQNKDKNKPGFIYLGKKEEVSSKKTPVLKNFGINLSEQASTGKLDPVVGRSEEIERVCQILSRRKKNNPILIGEPGVGKTAIAEGLALRIHQKKVSRILFDKEVMTLDLASLVAGTKYRGQFEERVKALMGELKNAKDIILFIDELHTLVGAGSASGSMDASNLFKPALARGEIQCIGATTLDEYRQYIEKDGALARRFQTVLVDATNVEETIEILQNVKVKYEAHHNVNYTEEAINACVKMSDRYISTRLLPDKAIDVMDEVGSRVHLRNVFVPKDILSLEEDIKAVIEKKKSVVRSQMYEEATRLRDKAKDMAIELQRLKDDFENREREKIDVTQEDVAEVIGMMTGINTSKIAKKEGEKLMKMANHLNKYVIGQNMAVDKISKAIQRTRVGLKNPNKPIGSFIFLGSTGVGKTELVKVLAQYLFDKKEALIRIDMSEYMEKFSASRLVGAPPGYVGYEEGGQLTERVRRNPYSVILLDEVEKAHPDIYSLLLQVLDEGFLTDSLGRKIDFRNTIIVMTSNIGSTEVDSFGSGIGFSSEAKDNKHIIHTVLKRTFKPEFLNRLDDIIIFRSLNKEDALKILDITLKKLYNRVKVLGIELKISKKAKSFIVEKGFDPKNGARALDRALQKYLEDQLAEEMLKLGNNIEGTFKVDYNKKNDALFFKFINLSKNKEVLNVGEGNNN